MTPEQVGKFYCWFEDYVTGFYGKDEFLDANIKLKHEHSLRTCEEMKYLTDALILGDNQKRIAEVIALLHDIGRFAQLCKYRTYNDHISADHCQLGLEVLREEGVLDNIERNERRIIEKAIKYHGRKRLPDSLNGEALLYSKLIRDADKIDIFYVVITIYEEYRNDPESFKLEIELPDRPECSKSLLKKILKGHRINYSSLKLWNDVKLLQLAWVYDVNFVPTLKRIKKRKFLERIVDFLPETEDIEAAKEKILNYVDARIEQGN